MYRLAAALLLALAGPALSPPTATCWNPLPRASDSRQISDPIASLAACPSPVPT